MLHRRPFSLATSVPLLAISWIPGAGIPAQPPAPATPLEWIAAAEEMHASGRREDATWTLLDVRRQLNKEPESVLRASLLKTTATLFDKCDIHVEVRRKAFVAVAEELNALSRTYQLRKWYRMARRVLRPARFFAPEVTIEMEQRLDRLSPETSPHPPEAKAEARATPPEPTVEEQDLLPGMRVDHLGDWTLSNGQAISAKITDGQTRMLISTNRRHKDDVVSVEIERRGEDKAWMAGLIFGVDDLATMYLLDIKYFGGDEYLLAAWFWKGRSNDLVSLGKVQLTAKTAGDWVRGGVRIDGKNIHCVIEGREALSVVGPRPAHGAAGFFVSGNTPYAGPYHYRKLRIHPPKAEEKTDPGAEKTKRPSLTEELAAVEKLIADKAGEEATLRLLDLRARARRQKSDAVAATVASAVAELMQGVDPLHGKYRAASQDIATALVAAAEPYTGSKWHDIAGYLLGTAAAYDEAIAGRALAANLAVRAAIDKADAGLDAEPQGAAENDLLRQWFAGGREPLDVTGWVVDETGARAATGKDGNSLLLSKVKHSGKGGLSVQCKTTTEKCLAGILIGWKGQYGGHMVWWEHDPQARSTAVVLSSVSDGNFKAIGNAKRFRFSPEARSQWMTVCIRYAKDKVLVKLGGAPEFAFVVRDHDFSGEIGLYTWVAGKPQPVAFRNLKVIAE